MVEIIFKGEPRQVPSIADECTPEQYRRLLRASCELSLAAIDEDTLLDEVMSALLGVTSVMAYKVPIIEEVMAQKDKISGILEGTTLKLETCRNLMPEFHGWKGPGDMFNGLTFGAWLTAYTAFCQAVKDGIDEDERERLFIEVTRALYHREGKNLADPPMMLVTHCINYFASVWHAIMTQPINIGGSDIDFSIIFKAADNAIAHLDDHTGWIGVAMEVAKDGPFGPLNQVNESDFWDVLIYIYKVKFEYLHSKKPKPNA